MIFGTSFGAHVRMYWTGSRLATTRLNFCVDTRMAMLAEHSIRLKSPCNLHGMKSGSQTSRKRRVRVTGGLIKVAKYSTTRYPHFTKPFVGVRLTPRSTGLLVCLMGVVILFTSRDAWSEWHPKILATRIHARCPFVSMHGKRFTGWDRLKGNSRSLKPWSIWRVFLRVTRSTRHKVRRESM